MYRHDFRSLMSDLSVRECYCELFCTSTFIVMSLGSFSLPFCSLYFVVSVVSMLTVVFFLWRLPMCMSLAYA